MTNRRLHARILRVPRPPVASSPAVRAVMRANRAKGTGPELALRRALSALGVRGYEAQPSNLPGRPDFVFRRARLAIFVHGCFWHRHGCRKGSSRLPRANREYWKVKFRLNVQRDQRKMEALLAKGWFVLVIWECEIKNDPKVCAARVDLRRHTLTNVGLRSKDVSS